MESNWNHHQKLKQSTRSSEANMNKSSSSSSSLSSPSSSMSPQSAIGSAAAVAAAAAVANLPFSIDHILSSQTCQPNKTTTTTTTTTPDQQRQSHQHQQQQNHHNHHQHQAAIMMLNQSLANNSQQQQELLSSAMFSEQLAHLAAANNQHQAHLINPNALATVAHQQQLMAVAAAAAASQRQQQQQQTPALIPLDALNSLKLAVSQANNNINAIGQPVPNANLLSCFMASILRLQQHQQQQQQQQQAHKQHSLIDQQRRTTSNLGTLTSCSSTQSNTQPPSNLNQHHLHGQQQQILATNFHRSLTNQSSTTQGQQLATPTTTTSTNTSITTSNTPTEKLDTSKPAHSYIGLIGMCILSSPEKRMVLNDVYQFILDNYPYYRNRGSGWRNSVRHNLSLNECFQKAGRAANGKGHYWTIHPANMEDFMNGDFRRRRAQRKVRRWNNMDVPSDESDDESMEDATKPPLPEHFKRSLEMHRRLELSYLQWQVSCNQQLNGASLNKSD